MNQTTPIQHIAVVGAGNGGITTAADLMHRGFQVKVYTSPETFHDYKTILPGNPLSVEENDGLFK